MASGAEHQEVHIASSGPEDEKLLMRKDDPAVSQSRHHSRSESLATEGPRPEHRLSGPDSGQNLHHHKHKKHFPRAGDSRTVVDAGSDSDSDDDLMELTTMNSHCPKCKRFCSEYGHQCSGMTKTATAIVVALLWSTTITSLMKTVFSYFFTEYKQRSYWLGLFLVSIFVLSLIPTIIFKNQHPHDLWAVMLLIEILGHMWGFKVKDLVTYGAYESHYLSQVFANLSTAPTYSYCNLVAPDLDTSGAIAPKVAAESEGFLGYNLHWGMYTHDTSAFDGYYPYEHDNATGAPSPSPGGHRQLAEAATKPSPAPYAGPRIDVNHTDQHEMGPGQVCSFEYKTVVAVSGFRVEQMPRMEYVSELGSRIVIWMVMIAITTATVVVFRLLYNKVIFKDCCNKKMTKHMKHEYTHIQNHLIADAFANAMGWVSAWVVWWALCIVILLIANFGGFGSSPCNGMHAFPLATVFIGFVVFYLLVYGLRWGRMACWKPTVKCCPDLKVYLGGVGELQNGFMLGWYLVSLCSYIHTVFISLYFEEGVADFSPFDDVTYAHQTPTIELAVEELIEAGVWTALGVTYLTFTQLQIKAQHRETELLSEAKRRLSKYFALTSKAVHTTIAEDITELIDRRRHESKGMEQRAAIILRAFGIWMGLTIELAIHLVIELIDDTVLAAYSGSSGSAYGYGSSYGSSYSSSGSSDGSSSGSAYYAADRRQLASYGAYYGEVDYDQAAIKESLKFATEFAFSATLTGVFFAAMFIGHHCRWRLSSEKEVLAAVKLQALHRGRVGRKKAAIRRATSEAENARRAPSTATEAKDAH